MKKIGIISFIFGSIFIWNIAHATGCNSTLDCGFAQTCENGMCSPECRASWDCSFGQTCDNGFCMGGQPECRSSLDCGFAQHCSDEGRCVGNSAGMSSESSSCKQVVIDFKI